MQTNNNILWVIQVCFLERYSKAGQATYEAFGTLSRWCFNASMWIFEFFPSYTSTTISKREYDHVDSITGIMLLKFMHIVGMQTIVENEQWRLVARELGDHSAYCDVAVFPLVGDLISSHEPFPLKWWELLLLIWFEQILHWLYIIFETWSSRQ